MIGRAGQREAHVDLDDDRLVSQAALAAPTPTSEEELEAREAGAHLARALTKLSAPQRAAFDLVKAEGLSHAQAAAVLGTSVTGIKLRLHRVYLAPELSWEPFTATVVAAGASTTIAFINGDPQGDGGNFLDNVSLR